MVSYSMDSYIKNELFLQGFKDWLHISLNNSYGSHKKTRWGKDLKKEQNFKDKIIPSES